MKCRHCTAALNLPFLDLGSAPPSNAFLTDEMLNQAETWYPLRLLVCEQCWLVQTEDFSGREALFSDDYVYFSSWSISWLAHAKAYVNSMVSALGLDANSHVVEVASNDGYLLQFLKATGIPCLGIEPTASTARAARAKGIEVIQRFFGVDLADELVKVGKQADLIVANNVLAHVPDINDFVAGFAVLLKAEGVATFEFPHLLKMVSLNQFDTAYHEHFSYLSLGAVTRVFASNGLNIFNVEELSTHGGSLRVFAQRIDTGVRGIEPSVQRILDDETLLGMNTTEFYQNFQVHAVNIVRELNTFLLNQVERGSKVVGYGAAAKGNTLLNFAGVRSHLVSYVADLNPSKQGKYLPGSRIPVVSPNKLAIDKPDVVLVLPWNLGSEVTQQLAFTHEWGAKLYVAVPKLTELCIDTHL